VGVGPIKGEGKHSGVLGRQDVAVEDFGDSAALVAAAHFLGSSSSVAVRAQGIIAELAARKR